MFRRLFVALALFQLLLLATAAAVMAAVLPGPLSRQAVLLVAAVAALVLLAVASLAGWLAGRSTGTLRALTAATERLTDGDGATHVFAAGRDEVATLARAFNQMADRLTARIAGLEEDREQLRTVLGGMVEGVVALDAEQRVVFANNRAATLLEFPTPNPVGRRIWEVVRQRPLLDVVRRTTEGQAPYRCEVDWNGAFSRSLTVHAAPLPGSPPRGAVIVVHDTTDLRRLERLRHEFVANVSHELKTPLSVIKACAETLLDGVDVDAADRERFLRRIMAQSDRLHNLILDLLTLARIESGDELFEFRAVAVAEVVAAAVERHHGRAEARRQTLNAVPPQAAEGVVAWADEEAVEQVLDNLLDNAVKYTPEGGRIEVHWHGDDRQVILEVRDNGIGIPEADLPRIFERFYRVDKARSREMGGTGLGLAIVKHLVQGMNGTVRATSRLGSGSTFTIALPRSART
jgi:two-component system phosphate regulon sensor histidine kinase PhoR